jgi:glycerate kinase
MEFTSAGLKVLVVPDKFKGTLSASDAAKAIWSGWLKARPQDQLSTIAMSDGGDGFGEVMAEALLAEKRVSRTINAAHLPCRSPWFYRADRKLAIIESARVIGLAMLPPGKFHPFELDTTGLARVLLDALEAGAEHVIIGIGGSATNDAGFGMARGLGFKFYTADATEITQWTALNLLDRITKPENNLFKGVKVEVAVDVRNPLLGPTGCSRVYGPQKGLKVADYECAEGALDQLVKVVGKSLGKKVADKPGAGAAGGLGYGLMAFLGAKAVSGFELFAEAVDLERHVKEADVVVTAEGCIDASSEMGKGTGALVKLCRKLKKPVIGLAGHVASPLAANRTFFRTGALTLLVDRAEAMARPKVHLKTLAQQVASTIGAADVKLAK